MSEKNGEEFDVEILYPYEPKNAKQLKLVVGTVVTVLATDVSGWYIGRDKSNSVGIFPSNYVRRKIRNEPRIRGPRVHKRELIDSKLKMAQELGLDDEEVLDDAMSENSDDDLDFEEEDDNCNAREDDNCNAREDVSIQCNLLTTGKGDDVNAQLRKKIKGYEESLRKSESEVKKQRSSVLWTKSQLSIVSKKLEESKAECEKLGGEVNESVEFMHIAQRGELDDMKKKMEAEELMTKDARMRHEEEIGSISAELERVKSQLGDMKSNESTWKEKCTSLETQCKMYEKQVSEMKVEAAKIENEHEKRKVSAIAMEAHTEQLKKRDSELKESRSAVLVAQERLKESEKSKRSVEEVLTRRESQIESLKREVKKLEDIRVSEKQAQKSSSGEFDKVVKQLKQRESELNQKEVHLQEKESALKDSRAVVDGLTKSKKEIETTLKERDTKITTFTDKIQSLEKKLHSTKVLLSKSEAKEKEHMTERNRESENVEKLKEQLHNEQQKTKDQKREIDLLSSQVHDLEGKALKLQESEQWRRLLIDTARYVATEQVKVKNFVRAALAGTKNELQVFYSLFRTTSEGIVDHVKRESSSWNSISEKLKSEMFQRRKLFNTLQEIRGNIRVFCRLRPVSGPLCISVGDCYSLQLLRNGDSTEFEYDRVFDMDSTQDEVFGELNNLAISVLDGYNVCIFAYGQTGSGKTYTMYGITQRALYEIFRIIESRDGLASFSLRVSMLEIYNESIFDLLKSRPRESRLDVRVAGKNGVEVLGLNTSPCKDAEAFVALFEEGNANRAVGETNLNLHSSRSHMIVTVYVESKNLITGATTQSKLHLVDLAGSERVKKSESIGARLVEAQNINRSLSALGDVISVLAAGKKGDIGHVPYRNSKLTTVLQDSIGGNAKTLMFVTISPRNDDGGECYASLKFASRVRNVINAPKKLKI